MGIACRSSCKTTSSKMNAFVAVVASLVAAANAGVAPLAVGAPLVGAPLVAGKTLVRAPAHDSASIANHRLGGNFAYAVQTAEAFAEVTPKIAHQTIPVAEHTHVHQPAAIRTIQPAPIVTKTFSASPVLAQSQFSELNQSSDQLPLKSPTSNQSTRPVPTPKPIKLHKPLLPQLLP